MDTSTATQILASLSSEIRLDIYRLLMRRGPTGMVSGEIAAALGLPPTNTSFHLKAMVQAGLLAVEQEGRYQRYRARMPVMRELVAYLTEECCIASPPGGVSPDEDTCCVEAVTAMPTRTTAQVRR